jgi:hypothetical protein
MKRWDGVADGTRTHDDQNHNLGLYQLSYSHRRELSSIAAALPGRQAKGTTAASGRAAARHRPDARAGDQVGAEAARAAAAAGLTSARWRFFSAPR